ADSHAVLYTPLNAEDLLKHYGEQLRAAGWTAGTRAVVSGAAIETWQLTKDGRDYYGLLSVIEQPNATRTLGFRVATERER
ncbi:MAG TPA: hypothetical protein VK864_10935, partial [Longimicrobiales bacterium]|nr:hypothetical protein [Longimicrobiales bacterium]